MPSFFLKVLLAFILEGDRAGPIWNTKDYSVNSDKSATHHEEKALS